MSEQRPDRPAAQKRAQFAHEPGGMRFSRGLFGWVVCIGLAAMIFMFFQNSHSRLHRHSAESVPRRSDGQEARQIGIEGDDIYGEYLSPATIKPASGVKATFQTFRTTVPTGTFQNSAIYLTWILDTRRQDRNGRREQPEHHDQRPAAGGSLAADLRGDLLRPLPAASQQRRGRRHARQLRTQQPPHHQQGTHQRHLRRRGRHRRGQGRGDGDRRVPQEPARNSSASAAAFPAACCWSASPGTGKTLLAKAIAGEADVPVLQHQRLGFRRDVRRRRRQPRARPVQAGQGQQPLHHLPG